MGGYGSTRWNGQLVRDTTDGCLRLDVRWLARNGYLRPGDHAIRWTLRGRITDQITVRVDASDPASIALDYRTRAPGEDWRPVREFVPITRTPCPFGGSRPWFACPGCGSRRAVLYSRGERFRCVRCHRLAYGSTREQPRERARRRVEAIRGRLASTGALR